HGRCAVKAAIYARKSTEQNVADEAKSVTRQVENARAFAAARSWTVADAHVYIDDGISGAEFEKRPGFMRMMATLPRPSFGVLVGGRVFGYHNRVIYNGIDRDGNPLRSHVEREINDAEAAVVRRIFALYDAGEGLKRIAKLLTSEGAPQPKHFRGADGLMPA